MNRPLLIFTAEVIGEEARLCPHFRCATCGQPIDDATDAIAVIERDDRDRYTGAITVVHKGFCDRYDGHPWRRLDELLMQLAGNSGLDLAREAQR